MEALERLQPRDHALFTGRLERAQLRLGDKAIALALRAPGGDFCDWAAIEAWSRAILTELDRDRPPGA